MPVMACTPCDKKLATHSPRELLCYRTTGGLLRPPRVENNCAVASSTRLRKKDFATGALAGADLEQALTSEGGSSWLVGKNPAWSSAVLDLRNPDVRTFLLDNLIDPAFKRGFQGVFLDTLDSFTLAASGEAQTQAFAEAQTQLISDIRARHPNGKIILNRGFHLPDSVIGQVDGLALESWRNGYNAKEKLYYKVSETDRQWLDKQLQRWREARPDMPMIAIDYVADASRAGELAGQLRRDGFVPWVANPALDRLSPSQPAQVKRHVLVIHDLPEFNMDRSAAHRFGGIVLERSGFIPQYHSALEPLPTEPTEDR